MDKCADCGFLGLITKAHGSCVVADYQYRTKGYQGGILTEGASGPHCLVHAEELHNEQENGVTSKEILDIISRPREDCKHFIQWRSGCTLKEHHDMLDTKWMLEFQAEQSRLDREWREGQEIKAQQRHTEQLELLRSIHKRELIYLGIGVTVAIIIITVIGAAIEADWFPPWFGLFD